MTIPYPVEPLARDKKLFCFGFGYTASFLAPPLQKAGWTVGGTTTDRQKHDFLKKRGIDAVLFDHGHMLPDPLKTLEGVTHVLLSVPPVAEGDPAFNVHGNDLAALPSLEWVGYLSTTGVYGNHDGNWVTERTPAEPSTRRGSLRQRVELQWLSMHQHDALPLHIFRLSGIYGPGRSAIDSVKTGNANRIEKKGHVFNRIHVADIVQALIASMNRPNPGAIYNLSDDMPSPSHEVISYACSLAGVPPPPVVPFDQAEMAPIVRSFYKDNKRVKNDRIKQELGVDLIYPDYRHGLPHCLDIDEATSAFLEFESRHTA